jgi:hypothetical protein
VALLMTARYCRLAVLFVLGTGACLLAMREGAPGPQARAGEAPAFEKQINLVYTVSNFGYTETCG